MGFSKLLFYSISPDTLRQSFITSDSGHLHHQLLYMHFIEYTFPALPYGNYRIANCFKLQAACHADKLPVIYPGTNMCLFAVIILLQYLYYDQQNANRNCLKNHSRLPLSTDILARAGIRLPPPFICISWLHPHPHLQNNCSLKFLFLYPFSVPTHSPFRPSLDTDTALPGR